VRVSERDLRLLTVIGEDGGARLSLLRARLQVGGGGGSDTAARHWTDRMVRAGYLRRTWVLRAAWFTLTPAGARLVGLVDEDGKAAARVVEAALVVEHTNTVGRLRLWFASEYPEATWVPERTFWRQQADHKALKFRRPDGALDLGGRKVGVEVELRPKHAEDYRVIVGQTHPDLAEVWWYCPPALVSRLRHALGQGADQYTERGGFAAKRVTPWDVRPLPEGVWP
jgi:hypothetical protein